MTPRMTPEPAPPPALPPRAMPLPLQDALGQLPRFTRQPLTQAVPGLPRDLRMTHDLIVREPSPGWPVPGIVGLVSRRYQLVSHHQVLERVAEHLAQAGHLAADPLVRLHLSAHGTRMGFSFDLPGRDPLDPGDGHRVGLQIGGLNSVDRSSRLRVFLGWLRFVCSNGLVSLHLEAEYRRRHTEGLDLDAVNRLLRERLAALDQDAARFRHWYQTPLDPSALLPWLETVVRPAWGLVAATRAYHILTRGQDVQVIPFSPAGGPADKPVRPLGPVPGSSAPARHHYAVAQALSWLASQRPEPEERLQWQQAIPPMLQALPASAARPAA